MMLRCVAFCVLAFAAPVFAQIGGYMPLDIGFPPGAVRLISGFQIIYGVYPHALT